MEKSKARQRIEKLKKVINYHRYLYHVLNTQEISDQALDSLKHELYQLEQQFPELITPDSPTQRVSGQVQKGFKKIKHSTLMLSLEDIFSEKELQAWENYLKKLAPSFFSPEYFCEQKVDGFAVELTYEKGILKTGSTRGDGLIGEDVTQNLKTIQSIPLKLEYIEFKIQNLKFKIPEQLIVRGEVYMDKKDFAKFKSAYSNPRNLAAGSIRQLDPKLAAFRPLKFMAYDIVTDIGQKSHSQEHQILLELGFKADPGKICQSLSDIVNYWQEIEKKRESLPFQIDGLVVSINENSVFNELGVAGKSPRAARALKFSAEQATTIILDIKTQIGRTGAITPIAVLKPVKIGGVTITRATLHNESEIKRLGVKIGDTAVIERAGDVIPSVFSILTELRTGKEKDFIFPKTCPACSAKLSKPIAEAIWRCLNQNCPARKRENLYHFVSKQTFDIKGLGPKIIDRLIDENLISSAEDIFTLQEGDLVPLERFAEKSASNLISSMQSAKKLSLPRFIFALGIRQVGQETALDLTNHFGSIARLQTAKKQELEEISNIGPKTAQSIYNWFQSKKNQKFINQLLEAGVQIIEKAMESRPLELSSNSKLKKKIFVLTGALKSMTREQARERIRFLGGRIAESVSKNTDYLVAGKDPGSKLEKAEKLKVRILNEEEFLDIIK